MRRRGGRKRAFDKRSPMALPEAANQRWSLDFVSDALSAGRRFRVLAIVDDFTRECLGLVTRTSPSGLRVGRELDRIGERHGCHLATIVSDNGTGPTIKAHKPGGTGETVESRRAFQKYGHLRPGLLHYDYAT